MGLLIKILQSFDQDIVRNRKSRRSFRTLFQKCVINLIHELSSHFHIIV